MSFGGQFLAFLRKHEICKWIKFNRNLSYWCWSGESSSTEPNCKVLWRPVHKSRSKNKKCCREIKINRSVFAITFAIEIDPAEYLQSISWNNRCMASQRTCYSLLRAIRVPKLMAKEYNVRYCHHVMTSIASTLFLLINCSCFHWAGGYQLALQTKLVYHQSSSQFP